MPGITYESGYQRERMMRLGVSEKHLAQKMKVVSEEKRKSAVRVACELAFEICPVDLPVVDESLRQLLSGYKLSIEQVAKLEWLAAQLDEEYFNLHDIQNEEMQLNPKLCICLARHAQYQLSLAPGEMIQLSQQPKQFMKQPQPLMMAWF